MDRDITGIQTQGGGQAGREGGGHAPCGRGEGLAENVPSSLHLRNNNNKIFFTCQFILI